MYLNFKIVNKTKEKIRVNFKFERLLFIIQWLFFFFFFFGNNKVLYFFIFCTFATNLYFFCNFVKKFFLFFKTKILLKRICPLILNFVKILNIALEQNENRRWYWSKSNDFCMGNIIFHSKGVYRVLQFPPSQSLYWKEHSSIISSIHWLSIDKYLYLKWSREKKIMVLKTLCKSIKGKRKC